MRGADAGPLSHLNALPALWVRLTYDQGALDAASDLIRGWTAEQRDGLRRAAARDGLAGAYDGLRLRDLAAEVLGLAEAGLAARGRLAGARTRPAFLRCCASGWSAARRWPTTCWRNTAASGRAT